MSQYILAIDQGTTGTTALLFDHNLTIRGKANKEFPQHFPKPGWVEHDLEEIWDSVRSAVRGAMEQSGVHPNQIVSIGITNQRETTCLWEREGGAQACRAIVWQDRRTAAKCAKLKKRGLERGISRKTGLLIDPYFSATKLQWMLGHIPGARAAARKGKLLFGTIDSYLVYRMTGGKHVTDVTNASRTLLMDLKKRRWDSDLLKLFQVPAGLLPEILPSAVVYGKTKGFLDFPDGIPVAGIAGDQQAALFGQACFRKGSAKCTYGTGAFVLVNTGDAPVLSKNRLVTSVAWELGGRPTYCLEGSSFIAGAAVQWLRDGLRILSQSPEVEAMAREVPDSEGVVFLPALAGLGAPHWIPGATGLITGLTRGTGRGHLARATLEGIALQIRELLEAMGKDMGRRPSPLKVDGGASENDLLMQIQADLLGVEVVRSQIVETTALGAGLQAGLAVGFWSGLEEIRKKWRAAERFRPAMTARARKEKVARWDRAVAAAGLLVR